MPETMLTFVHMTDVHILDKGAEPFLGVDTAANLRTVIKMIRSLNLPLDFVAISGDLVQDREDAAYQHLQELLSDLRDVPVLLALGNHDNRVSFQRVFLEENNTDEQRRYYYSHHVNGHKIIVLDSRESGKVYGTFDETQMTWLSQELADGIPTILIFHHPPVMAPYALLDDHILVSDSTESLRATIANGNVIGILNGHIHFNSSALFAGVPVFAGGHVAFQIDPYEKDGMRFIQGSGFNVVTVQDQVMTVQPIILPGDQETTFHLTTERLSQLKA